MAPTITSISPNYGGVGPFAAGMWTITGTGFSTAPKATRFVDTNLVDIFTGVTCAVTTSCTAILRPDRVAPGVAANLTVIALVASEASTGTLFLYYGAPIITSLSPNTGPYNVATAYTLNAAPLASPGTGFPGIISTNLAGLYEETSSCATSSSCARNARSLTFDCCMPQGAQILSLGTPGGGATSYFLYGPTPATPTVTSISPPGGPTGGGGVVTITGTNFIPGTNSPGGVFGVALGTSFTFSSPGVSIQASSVNCSSSTTCTAIVPGGPPGPASVEVFTICPINSPLCASSNARPSVSIPTVTAAAYTYAGLKITSPEATLYTSENGQAAQFTVALHTQPAANVNVAVSINNIPAPATLSTSVLNFTTANWNVPQPVTVTGVNDDGLNGHPVPSSGNTGFSMNLAVTSADANYNGLNGSPPSFTHIDNETKNFFIAPQNGLVTTRAGGTASFTVVLSSAPTAAVTLNLTSNDPLEGTVSPSVLTFLTSSGGPTGWNVPRTVTVTGVDGATAGRDIAYSIILRFTSADTTYGDPNMLSQPDVFVTNTGSGPPLPEDFDGVTAPLLPPVWTSDKTGTPDLWTTVSTSPVDSSPNAAFGPETATVGVTNLVSPVIPVPAGSWQLRFRNLYNLETNFDGMVLEISIAGGAFADIVTAGGSFAGGGYTGTLSMCCSNPLPGRSAWSGLSGGTAAAPAYLTTLVNLPPAASGQNIQLRWRVGCDGSVVAAGQAGTRIDTLTLTQLPTVVTGVATGISLTGATLNGTVNPNGTATNGRFELGLTTSYGSFTGLQSLGSGVGAVPITSGGILGLTCGRVYHFRAVAFAETGTTNGLDATFFTTAGAACAFTDDSLVAGVTAVKAVHVTELRARIETLRVKFGLGAVAWTNTLVAGTTVIQAVHITEMRAALNAVYTAAPMALPSYTDPGLAAGTPVKAAHIADLRSAVIAIE